MAPRLGIIKRNWAIFSILFLPRVGPGVLFWNRARKGVEAGVVNSRFSLCLYRTVGRLQGEEGVSDVGVVLASDVVRGWVWVVNLRAGEPCTVCGGLLGFTTHFLGRQAVARGSGRGEFSVFGRFAKNVRPAQVSLRGGATKDYDSSSFGSALPVNELGSSR